VIVSSRCLNGRGALGLAFVLLAAQAAAGQEDPKAVLRIALKSMGGAAKVRGVKSVSIALRGGEIKEYHDVRLKGRLYRYRSVRPSGRRLEVILARRSAYIVDRDAKGVASAVTDLDKSQTMEAGYERDLFILPLLLPLLLERDEALLTFAGRTPAGDALVTATVPAAEESREASVRYTLRFSKKSGLLVGARSLIPSGPMGGKTRKVVYKSYKMADSVMLPREMIYKVDEGKVSRMPIRLKLGNKIPLTVYLKPKVVKRKRHSKGKKDGRG